MYILQYRAVLLIQAQDYNWLVYIFAQNIRKKIIVNFFLNERKLAEEEVKEKKKTSINYLPKIATNCVASKTSMPVQIVQTVPIDNTHDDVWIRFLLVDQYPDEVKHHSAAASHLNDESMVRIKVSI